MSRDSIARSHQARVWIQSLFSTFMSSSVYFPAPVVIALRRIANVISGLTISNQYFLLKKTRTEEEQNDMHGGYPQPLQSVDTRRPWRESIFRLNPDSTDHNVIQCSDHTVTTATAELPGSELRPRSSRPWSTFLSSLSQPQVHKSEDPIPSPDRKRQPRQPDLPHKPPQFNRRLDTLHQLLQNPALYDPLRTPRYPIVLCHGLYGFDSRGPSKFPSMRMHYWSNVLNVLRGTLKAEVIVTSVPGTGSIVSRSENLDRQLQTKARGRGVNFLAHSMGGLDCRHLITHLKPEIYAPLSLTSIATPHRGSPFMDWCVDNIGIGKLRREELQLKSRNTEAHPPKVIPLPPPNYKETKSALLAETSLRGLSLSSFPSSFTTLLLSVVDSPAYSNLTSTYLEEVFNPATPNDPSVKYFSVASRLPSVSIWHPFWLPKMVLDNSEEKHRSRLKAIWDQDPSSSGPYSADPPLWARDREWGNDGLVTVQSAKWGEFLGILEGCDHWEMRGARGIEFGVDLPAIPAIGLGAAAMGATAQNATATSDGWGLPDWMRIPSVWGKDNNKSKAQAGSNAQDRQRQRNEDRKKDDAVVKSSTENLSAVLDWLTDQVPSPASLNAKNKGMAEIQAKAKEHAGDPTRSSEPEKARKNELETKGDLERFYVALARKLYDEGL